MPRDALAERMVAQSSPFHAILRNDADMADTKPKAGAPPKIQIMLETRSGNKTVSKVHGLEPYYISPQPLADELRKTCAGSTSVDKLQGSSPKAPVMEVMIQGPQKDAIIKALEKRGVNRNWVEVVDKTKGKKK
jgi:translation initiation factor 2D